MISLKNMSKSFPDGEIFSNVNLTIQGGMRAGLVGRNGSGKTTLLRIMIGEEAPDSGNVQVGKSITIGYLTQDIIPSSDRSILEEVLEAYPEVRDLEGKITSLTEAMSVNSENMEVRNLELIQEIVCFKKIIFCFPRKAHNHIYTNTCIRDIRFNFFNTIFIMLSFISSFHFL